MGNNTISQKIDAYAQANLKALKQEEAKTGRKMTKFDIAQYMLQHGKLNKNEYANWMNTTEGFNAQAMTQQQKTALKQGSVWGFAGYGGGEESYLDSMASFSKKTPGEKQNAISGHQMKLNETVAERKKKAAEMQKEIKQQQVTNQILNPNQALKEQKFKDHISSLPEVDATYTELMNDIKFQNMDKKQKTEFLLKTTGQKFYEAKERGDKEAMKEYLKQGIGLTFAYMDDKAGITDIKEDAKEFYGLNAFVDTIDKFVDDGDDSNLSFSEKTWETIKGAGDAVDGFIGTQGAAFMGTLAVAGKAAAAAGIGKVFALLTQAYFAYEGGTMVVDGAVDVANAQNKEEARAGGQELGTGAIMLGGVAKSVKQGYRNIKKQKAEEFSKTNEDVSDRSAVTRGTEERNVVTKDGVNKPYVKPEVKKTNLELSDDILASDVARESKQPSKRAVTTANELTVPDSVQALIDVLSSFKNKDGSYMFAEELKMLDNYKSSTAKLDQLKTAIDKKYKNRDIDADDYAKIKNSLNIILKKNDPSVQKMKNFSEELAEDYSNMIEPEVQNLARFFMGKDVKVEFDGKFYKAENETGCCSARSKGADSVYSKLEKKVIGLKTDVPANKQQADMLIGDAGGFRFTINSVDTGTINKIILETVPKNERVEFNKYFENSYKLTPAEKAKVNKNFLKYEKTITERAIHAQSDKFVAKLCEGIESEEIHLQEINNYCGRDGIPYFSQEHLQKITLSYNKWFEKASKSAEYSPIKDENGFIMALKDKFGNKFDRALKIEDSQTNADAIKESGYTTSQFNIIGKNGLKIEFQYRSNKIDDFAEYEHVPYDIRENKETVSGPEYNTIRNILQDKTKMSDDDYKKYYNPYLTQVYNYNRRIELGMPVGEKPTLNKTNFKNLTQEEIDLISDEGLKNLHDFIKAQRDKK